MAVVKPVTKAQAEKVLRDVKKKYAEYVKWAQEEGTGPTLIPNWNGDGHWYIGWEDCSPEEWAIQYSFGPQVDGVYTEPYYSFVLGIFPL